jgi:Ca-activated chloride channel homolog
MLKRFLVLGLIVLGLVSIIAAQSGRRVRNPNPVPASTPSQTLPSDTVVTDTETGAVYSWDKYSESAPNSARSIYDSPRDDRKSKKDKKETPKTTEPTTEVAKPVTTGDEEVLKVETSLISIPVSVYSRNGNYISELSKQNFKIFEDGKEQEVAYFGTTEKPFTVILLIDVSPSTAYKIEEIQNAAISFVSLLKEQDSVMVISFDENVHRLCDFTTDRNRINKAIRQTGFGGGTSLYEAVDSSLRQQLKKIEGRKAIVLFTDGVDTTSRRATFESNMRDAEESDAVIFPIYYNTLLTSLIGGGNGPMQGSPTLGIPGGIGGMGGGNRGNQSAEYARGRTYLESLAATTGGRVYKPDYNPNGLTTAFESIAEELRSQYSIGYIPQDEGEKGQRKQIRVRVNRPNLVIRARDSYIVGGSSQTQSSK